MYGKKQQHVPNHPPVYKYPYIIAIVTMEIWGSSALRRFHNLQGVCS
jgi:hypothetical protein